MNEAGIRQAALEILLDHIERGPRFSQVVSRVPDYTGDGTSLEYAVAIQLEVEELVEDLHL